MRANLGWNTWDVYHVNGVVHLESGLRVRFGILNTRTGEYKDNFDWKNNLRKLGPHSGRALGYASIEVAWENSILSLEYAASSDRLVCRIQAQQVPGYVLLVTVDGVWDTHLRSVPTEDGLDLYLGGDEWTLTPVTSLPVETSENSLQFNLSRPIIIDLYRETAPISGSANEILIEQREEYDRNSLKTYGWLGDSADGLTRSIYWNTIWEPLKGRVCTPVSREWCTNDFWGGYVLFDWDTFFCAVMAALESPDLSLDNLRAILDELTPSGFVPNFGSARSVSLDRSQPPVGSYCVLKVWRGLRLAESPEHPVFLEEVFDRLLQWHNWWMPARDGNRDGLLEWGSNLLDDPLALENHTLRAAMFESGLDNSPMYDQAKFNKDTHTMELADVGLNAMYALDAWALSEIAAEIGRDTEARILHEEYVDLAARINELLWNEDTGIYQNKNWDGVFSSSISPTNFYPLIAGIVPPERAIRMVNEHLLDTDEFWGEFVLPSIARNDPGYRQKEQIREGVSDGMSDYWRGRIWGPMNFLVSEGLRRYGFDCESHNLAAKSVRLFLQEWDGENHVHENYDDLTGEGDDVNSANPLYHWGALLALLGIQELVDCEAWEGWRFGNLVGQQASVDGIQLEEGRLEVKCGPDGLMVSLDRRALLQTDRAVIVRGYRTEPGRLQFRVAGEGDEVAMGIGIPELNGGAVVKVRTGQIFEMGAVRILKVSDDGLVHAEFPLPCEIEIIW